MKFRFLFPVFLLAAIFQGSILNLVRIHGITPDLILCLMVSIVFLYRDSLNAVVVATAAELLSDLLYSLHTGPGAIAMFATGLLVYLASEQLNKENITTMLIVGAAAAVTFNILHWGVACIVGEKYAFLYMLKLLPIMAAYDMIPIVIAYFFLIRRVVRFRQDRFYGR